MTTKDGAMPSPLNHHASDALLLSYAGGALPAGLALAVASHLALCGSCARQAALAEEVGGCLLDRTDAVPMAPDALERTLSRPVRAEPPAAPVAPPPFSGLPGPLRAAVAGLPDPQWRFLAPGIRQIDLTPGSRGGGSARLLRIAPGTTLPQHGHAGIELTLILSGSFTDEIGRFQAGDLAELEDDVVHQPIADSAEDCVCLIATEAPLRFSSLMGRLMQPLFGL
jgi:putative transcriptional regulator